MSKPGVTGLSVAFSSFDHNSINLALSGLPPREPSELK
jgi:hypothetical protein